MKEGLYESLINNSLNNEINQLKEKEISSTREISKNSATDVITKYLSEIIKDKFLELDNTKNENIVNKIDLANKIISSIKENSEDAKDLNIEKYEVFAKDSKR